MHLLAEVDVSMNHKKKQLCNRPSLTCRGAYSPPMGILCKKCVVPLVRGNKITWWA